MLIKLMRFGRADVTRTSLKMVQRLGLPLQIGTSVEVIILDNDVSDSVAPRNEHRLSLDHDVPLKNQSIDPSSPEYLVSISSLMTEWESAADQSAYQDW